MIILVSGLARCGSSLTMGMLDAGGFPCVGRHPAWEVNWSYDENNWLLNCEGMAVKLLDPHRFPVPEGPEYRVIWLDRDTREQAKSHIKMLRGLKHAHESHRADMRRLIEEERRPAIRTIRNIASRILYARYERIKRAPDNFAAEVQQLLECQLRILDMPKVLRNRQANCLPYLLEEQLLKEARSI